MSSQAKLTQHLNDLRARVLREEKESAGSGELPAAERPVLPWQRLSLAPSDGGVDDSLLGPLLASPKLSPSPPATAAAAAPTLTPLPASAAATHECAAPGGPLDAARAQVKAEMRGSEAHGGAATSSVATSSAATSSAATSSAATSSAATSTVKIEAKVEPTAEAEGSAATLAAAATAPAAASSEAACSTAPVKAEDAPDAAA